MCEKDRDVYQICFRTSEFKFTGALTTFFSWQCWNILRQPENSELFFLLTDRAESSLIEEEDNK